MNRITAVLLAMVALLVHALVVHREPDGTFAPAFESAHVAYVLGRNLAETGQVTWWTGAEGSVGGLASYPSPALVWLATLLELLRTNVDRAAQLVGVLCALATVFLSTRFDTDRIAGVIPALLLVSSGAVAAAGASGTEWPIAMFALAASFVALEHGRGRVAAVALALLVTSRPEGMFAAAALFVLAVMRRLRGPAALERGPAPSPLVFAPAVAALGVAHALGASLLSDARAVLELEPDAVSHGAAQGVDFLVETVTPILLVFPVVALLRRGLSAVGARALAVTVVWVAAVALGGGGPYAFHLAFAPALPIAFIAIQQGMARALDTYRRSMERLVWVSVSIALFGSLLASRFPGDLGRFPFEKRQERLYAAHAAAPIGRAPLLGRAGLHSEIRLVERLRRVGSFLGSRLPEEATVLSPWPGILQWRMRARVIDAFGRIAPDGTPARRWSPEPGPIDLGALLEDAPDLVLPSQSAHGDYLRGELPDLLPERFLTLDPEDGPARRQLTRSQLARYGIIVTTNSSLPSGRAPEPLLLAQRRDTAQPLVLESSLEDGRIQLDLAFEEAPPRATRLPQVLDSMLVAVTGSGRRALLDPRGHEVDGAPVSASGFVVDPAWKSAVSVARFDVAAVEERLGEPLQRLEVRILHHGIAPDDPRSRAAAPVAVELR